MKKLLAVLMIAGLFGFASCGGEKKADDAATAVDSTAAAPDAGVSAATPAPDSSMTAAPDSMKK